MKSPKIIISGGGTGGHIYPAIAIADAAKKRWPDAQVLFVGAKGRMEMEKVPRAGYPIEGLWISGLQRRLTLDNLSFPFKVLSSLLRANSIINGFRPDIAIGVGGYASGPLLRIAAARKVKTLIQEQNSYPGITNKILAPKVNRICVAYSGLERWFPKEKIVMTGNPIRLEVLNKNTSKSDALSHFGLKENRLTILAVGGSLGARTINESISRGAVKLDEANLQVIWQTGKSFFAQAFLMQSDTLKVHEFIFEMDKAYAAADIIVSRAGAMSISELCVVGKPVILVPSPNVSEDHQTKNALALSSVGSAVLVPDAAARQTLADEIIRLAGNSDERDSLAKNIAQSAMPNATENIVDEIEKLLNQNT